MTPLSFLKKMERSQPKLFPRLFTVTSISHLSFECFVCFDGDCRVDPAKYRTNTIIKINPFVPRGSRSVRINYKGIGAVTVTAALVIDNCRNSYLFKWSPRLAGKSPPYWYKNYLSLKHSYLHIAEGVTSVKWMFECHQVYCPMLYLPIISPLSWPGCYR